jgi:pyrimidine deaminase RibD-like protein
LFKKKVTCAPSKVNTSTPITFKSRKVVVKGKEKNTPVKKSGVKRKQVQLVTVESDVKADLLARKEKLEERRFHQMFL